MNRDNTADNSRSNNNNTIRLPLYGTVNHHSSIRTDSVHARFIYTLCFYSTLGFTAVVDSMLVT